MTSKEKYCMKEGNAENFVFKFHKTETMQIQQQNSFKITIKMTEWNKDMFAFFDKYLSYCK